MLNGVLVLYKPVKLYYSTYTVYGKVLSAPQPLPNNFLFSEQNNQHYNVAAPQHCFVSLSATAMELQHCIYGETFSYVLPFDGATIL
jgi:hypothetical protein